MIFAQRHIEIQMPHSTKTLELNCIRLRRLADGSAGVDGRAIRGLATHICEMGWGVRVWLNQRGVEGIAGLDGCFSLFAKNGGLLNPCQRGELNLSWHTAKPLRALSAKSLKVWPSEPPSTLRVQLNRGRTGVCVFLYN